MAICKQMDPGGIYHLELDTFMSYEKGSVIYDWNDTFVPGNNDILLRTKRQLRDVVTDYDVPLEYKENGVKVTQLLSDSMLARYIHIFRRLHILPSASLHFWKHSRKLISADATHLKGQLDGIANMLTAKDACDRNVTLMFTFCPNENGDNWDSTAATFFDCVDFEVSQFISDRDKGLMNIKEKYGKWLVNCTHQSCSIHIAKNVGITSQEGIKLVTQLANAPTKEKYDQCIKMIRNKCGTETCNKLEKQAPLFAYYHLQKSNNTFSTYGVVNNNPSEQQNYKYKIFRDLPWIRAILLFLSDMVNTFNERRIEAQALMSKGYKVTPVAKTKAEDGASTFISQCNEIKVTLNNVTFIPSQNGILSATFSISCIKGSASNTYMVANEVTLAPHEPVWCSRIKCKCNYYPLFNLHASSH